MEEDEIGGACGMCWGKWNVYWVLVGIPEEKRQLGKPWYNWEDIKMNPKK